MTGRLPVQDETPDRYPGTPGWVKAIGIVVLVLLLLAAFVVATGLGGPHGPQRHDASALSPTEIADRAAAA
jgi:hypothetical protein